MKARNSVSFGLEELHEFSQCKRFDRLFSEWECSGHQLQLRPTIDRISSKRGYDLENIHWMTWAENRFKEALDRRHNGRKVAQIVAGKIVRVFRSQKEAVRETGLSQANMSSALNGSRKYCGGYAWEYVDENPDLLPQAA